MVNNMGIYNKGIIRLEKYTSIEEMRKQIQECEGKHIQQVAYSTFHDCLTQICFGCMCVRTNL